MNDKEKAKGNKNVISLEQAAKEVREFVYFHDEVQKNKLDDDDAIIEKYPNIVSAVERGLLVIDEKKNPIYTLSTPVGEGENMVDKIVFKTRLKPMDNAAISKGLDIGKNQYEYILRCTSYLADQPKGIINALSKYDQKTVDQICTLFL